MPRNAIFDIYGVKTIGELAAVVGYSRQSVSRYFSGDNTSTKLRAALRAVELAHARNTATRLEKAARIARARAESLEV